MGRSVSVLRHSMVLAVVVVVIAAMAAASASAAQLAVVGERDSNQVSFISTATNKVVGGPVEVGNEPASVAITPDGKYAYVTDVFGQSVSVIETGLRRNVATIEEVGEEPFGIAITPDGKYAYVTDRAGDEVAVISTQARKLVKSIPMPVGAEPTGIGISPTGKFAYVADRGTDQVEAISTEAMAVIGQPIKVGDGPMGIEFGSGGTAYVVDGLGKEVSAINTATGKVTGIPLSEESGPLRGISISPDGSKAYVVGTETGPISVIDTGTKAVTEIKVEGEPQEVAFAANGKTVYVTENAPQQVEAISVEKGEVVGPPIKLPGEFPTGIALTPDQSPVAAFTSSSATVGVPAPFDGSASTDADGSIASYSWTFEDGRDATGVNALHTFLTPGLFNAKLTVVDDEGCGEAMVFTGRTAYCSGGESSVTHPVTVAVPAAAPATVCKSNFGVGGLTNNRKNGTAKLRVSLHAAGSILLFGKTVHAISRKTKAAGSMVLTIHARVELNKRLKKIHRARVPVRITFTPSSGCGYKTVHRSLFLLRAKKHRH